MEFERFADIKRLKFITDTLQSRLPEGAEVLDVGCGNGIISRSLGAAGYKVKGIDISEKTIEKAKALNKYDHVKFEVKNAEELVADGCKYHAIICSEVLEHLSEPGSLLSVVYQILDNDGILIVTVPNGKGPREVLVTKPVINMQKKKNLTWRIVKKVKSIFGYKGTSNQTDADDLTHIQFFTVEDLKKLAKENRFIINKIGKTNFIEDVFPFSLFTKRIKILQKWDCAIAEKLPLRFTGGFVTIWQKRK